MTPEQLHQYRGIVGLQLQFAERGDNHKVMEMQHVLERWIAEQVRDGILASLLELKTFRSGDIICNMTVDEIKAYRILQADSMKIFSAKGFEAFKSHQVETVELFVTGLITERILKEVKLLLFTIKN